MKGVAIAFTVVALIAGDVAHAAEVSASLPRSNTQHAKHDVSVDNMYVTRALDATSHLLAANSESRTQAEPQLLGCSGALNSASAIQNAMRTAGPGASIRIAPGVYIGDRATSGDPRISSDDSKSAGAFYSGSNGSATAPIVLSGCDPANPPVLASVSGVTRDGSYGLHITGDYWHIRHLVVRDAQKGIMFDHASHGVISNVVVHDIGDEAVHLRDGSSYNVIEHSRIYKTGGREPGFGEGVYVGSDTKAIYEHAAIGNVVRHVRFEAGITAEHIDVKEGASGTIIEYNHFDGTGISGTHSADSFVDIKGVSTIVRYNTGRRNGNANVVDAFQVRAHGTCCPTGANNQFHDNSVNLDGYYDERTDHGYVVWSTSEAVATTSANDARTDGHPTRIHNRNVNRP
jgi:hypothetical protein